MIRIIIEDDEGKTVAVPVTRDEFSIGRQEGNTIRLTEKNVSRRHARLLRKDGQLLVEDLASYVGTKVNGSPISALTALKDGDTILIGDYKMIIESDEPAAVVSPMTTGNTAPTTAANGAQAARDAGPRPAVAPTLESIAAAVPAEAREGGPTIPVKTLGEEAAPVGPPARLLVIGGPVLLGQSFLLERSAAVIGRTGENDIVIDHKSISRHHAKIVREADRFVVIDLESSNGLRVNGAVTERAEIAAGDVIEIGRLRLQLVVGDSLPDVAAIGGPGRGRLLVGAVVGAVAAGALAVLVFSGGGEKTEAPATGTASTAAPGSGGTDVAALIARARDLARQEQWADALEAVTKAAAAAPTNDEVRRLRESIEADKESAARFASLKAAFEAKDYDDVLSTFAGFPAESAYKLRALPMQKEAAREAIAQHLALAETAGIAGRCSDVEKAAARVLAIDADNQAARDLVRKCAAKSPALAAARPATPASRRAPAPTPPTPRPAARPAAAPAATPAAPPAGDPDEMIAQAREAWLKGQYAAAIDTSRRALRLKPGLVTAYQIIAVCSCSLRDQDAAAQAYQQLDDRNKRLVRSLCEKNGILLD